MINKIGVQIKKINPNAILPKYATNGSAGADLYACVADSVTINPGETFFIGTGVAVAIPEGVVGLIYARSGLACKNGVAPANKVGVIDSDYRGEIKVALHNHSQSPFVVENGSRIAQIVFAPYLFAQFDEVLSLSDTQRGADGFGSTGSK